MKKIFNRSVNYEKKIHEASDLGKMEAYLRRFYSIKDIQKYITPKDTAHINSLRQAHEQAHEANIKEFAEFRKKNMEKEEKILSEFLGKEVAYLKEIEAKIKPEKNG